MLVEIGVVVDRDGTYPYAKGKSMRASGDLSLHVEREAEGKLQLRMHLTGSDFEPEHSNHEVHRVAHVYLSDAEARKLAIELVKALAGHPAQS